MAKISFIMAQALFTGCVTFSNCLVTETSHFLKCPGKCLYPWEESNNQGSRKPLLESIGLCVTGSDCDGVQCDPTLEQCEQRISFNATNSCSNYYNGNVSELYLKSETVTILDELFIAVLEEGKMWSIEQFQREPLLFPPLVGDFLAVEYKSGLLACERSTKQCLVWSIGAKAWEPFPSLQVTHIRGLFLLLNGQPIMIGGEYKFSNDTQQKHVLVEIFNGTMWTRGPDFPLLSTLYSFHYFNKTTLGVMNYYSPFYLFVLDARNMAWQQFPLQSENEVAYLGCYVAEVIALDRLICYHANLAEALIFDLNEPNQEPILNNATVPTRPPWGMGLFYLKGNILFFYPLMQFTFVNSGIHSVDLSQVPMEWKRVDNLSTYFFNRPTSLFNVRFFEFNRS